MTQTSEPENNTESSYQEKQQQKKPEFIILEGTAEYINGPQGQGGPAGDEDVLEAPTEFFKGKPLRFMITLRFLSLIMTLACIWWALCSFIVLAIALVLATVFLFQSPAFNILLQRVWKLFKLSLVSLVSFFLAIFSPAFGMGTLFLYASLSDSAVFKQWLKRFRNIRGEM